jgi:hypothetical protein
MNVEMRFEVALKFESGNCLAWSAVLFNSTRPSPYSSNYSHQNLLLNFLYCIDLEYAYSYSFTSTLAGKKRKMHEKLPFLPK